jgi:outer membrane protein W
MHDPQHTPQNVDGLFARGLQSAEVKAPDGVWQGIADAMETDRLRKKVLWARLTAAASILLLLGFGAWYFLVGRVHIQEQGMAPAQTFAAHRNVQTLAKHATAELCPDETQPQVGGVLPLQMFAGKQVRKGAAYPRHIAPLLKKLQLRRIERVHSDAATPLRPEMGLPAMAFEPDFQRSVLDQPQPSPLRVNEQFASQYPDREKPKTDRGFGDEAEYDGPQARAFTLGGTASPDFSFASQTPVSLAKVAPSSKNALPEDAVTASRRSTPSTAFTTGMRFGYALSDHLGIQTGLLYTRRSTERDHAITQTGQAQAVETHFDLNSLEIPATIKYNIIDRPKFDYYVNSGVSATLFMNYKQSLVTETGVSKQVLSDQNDLGSPAQANLIASTGVQVKLGERVSMNIEPGLRYGLFVTDYSFTQRHPLSFNAFSGINYHF